jgi:hypothetical protein
MRIHMYIQCLKQLLHPISSKVVIIIIVIPTTREKNM